jgi:hypothetical protein
MIADKIYLDYIIVLLMTIFQNNNFETNRRTASRLVFTILIPVHNRVAVVTDIIGSGDDDRG